jgi:hypothetical protein
MIRTFEKSGVLDTDLGEVDMVRNLMMILGLSLAVAAFGCDSSSDGNGGTGGGAGTGGTGGTAGTGGMGGEGGTGGSVTPMDACTNVDDASLVCDPGFGDDVRACATAASGQGGATATCLVDDYGVSADCASCFGDETQCIFDNCLGSGCAAEPEGETCLTCRAENCDAAAAACKGDLEAACAG